VIRHRAVRSRIGRLALFAAVVVTSVPIAAFSIAVALAPEPTDFMCFWTGAGLVAGGQDPYDPATWSAAVDGLFPNWAGLLRRSPCPGGYAYPLSTAVATLPLGLLPLRVAALIWMVLLVGGIAAGIILLARGSGLGSQRTLLFAAITLGSQPAWLTALTSQIRRRRAARARPIDATAHRHPASALLPRDDPPVP
jgi:hypothetical protein